MRLNAAAFGGGSSGLASAFRVVQLVHCCEVVEAMMPLLAAECSPSTARRRVRP